MRSETQTVGAALRSASDRLMQAGVENPSVEAERLLQHALNLRRLDLYLAPDRPTTHGERARLRDALSRRCGRTPLQYLTGETEFRSLPFFVNGDVLIPRPETETLVETALTKLRGLPAPRIADVGTGSGCIAVSLTRERPDSRVVATDLSPAAVRVARANALRNGVRDRLRFVVGDLLEAFDPSPLFDAVVSNPPYIPTGEIPSLQPEVRDHEPRLALDGGEDGLRFHRRLAACAGRCLRRGGWLVLEVGDGQIDRVGEILRRSGIFGEVSHRGDMTGVDRVAVARRQ